MRKILSIVSILTLVMGITSCKNQKTSSDLAINPQTEEMQAVEEAIKVESPDFQEVKILENTLVYTHIYDGVVDVTTYTYNGDECMEAERMYVFPDQMSALRHYRKALEMAALYDDIALMGNLVKYDLKEDQYKSETEGKNLKQLKSKFDKDIESAQKDWKMRKEKLKSNSKCCK